MKVLHSFFLAIALCAVAMMGCSGDPPTLDRLQNTEEKIQIISPDQNSILVAGRVEEVIWVTTSHKPIKSYRVFLCDDTGTNDQEILGSAQVLPNLVLYHGILSPGFNGTYTIRVEAYGPGPNAVILLSAISEPFAITPSFQGEDGSSGVEVIIDQPNADTVWYTDYGGLTVDARVFDSEKCPVSYFGVNVYVSSDGNEWHYMPIPSSGDGHEHGQFCQGVDTPSNWFGNNFQIKLEAWTFGGAFMLATDVSEPFSIQRRNTGIFSISDPNEQTVWQNSGTGAVSGYLVDKNDIPVTGPVQIEFRVYPADPTSFTLRDKCQGFVFYPTGDGIVYCDNGQCLWDVQIPDLSYMPTDSYQLYVWVSYADVWKVFAFAISETFTIQ